MEEVCKVVPVLGPRTDLFELLEPCWEAFHQAAVNVELNPHSRFDIGGWMPLVE